MTHERGSDITPQETGPERFPSREEILSELRRWCESFEEERELTDERGVYLLEVVSLDKSKRFAFQRERRLPGQPQGIESSGTTIRSEDLDDGYSITLADYDPETGKWIDQ
jgi:hypothetical protein